MKMDLFMENFVISFFAIILNHAKLTNFTVSSWYLLIAMSNQSFLE